MDLDTIRNLTIGTCTFTNSACEPDEFDSKYLFDIKNLEYFCLKRKYTKRHRNPKKVGFQCLYTNNYFHMILNRFPSTLKYLILGGITIVNNRDFFSNLNELVVLDMKNTHSELDDYPIAYSVCARDFEKLVNLRVLKINIKDLCDLEEIVRLVNLDELELGGYIKFVLKEGTFKNLKRLKILKMIYFPIEKIEENAFCGLDQLVELKMKCIGIYEVDREFRLRVESNSFKGLNNLKKMRI